MLRETFDLAWPDHQDTIRAGLKHLVANQPMTVEQWSDLTYVQFPDQRELRAYLAQVYAHPFTISRPCRSPLSRKPGGCFCGARQEAVGAGCSDGAPQKSEAGPAARSELLQPFRRLA
ncbi:hypothetical protein [Streptomyces sp. Isolate_219]|uniref:hypothetical protein n=1 Tax=Streptomyces sp. Isolate_219 TaxID=2950110 RepID=UPI0021C704E2|nr:hypothetical protein [Streptomyces sp. Isolate_219]MCR8575969.1 hypothetical protein [Streptomyces sp. Isolate_219]